MSKSEIQKLFDEVATPLTYVELEEVRLLAEERLMNLQERKTKFVEETMKLIRDNKNKGYVCVGCRKYYIDLPEDFQLNLMEAGFLVDMVVAFKEGSPEVSSQFRISWSPKTN